MDTNNNSSYIVIAAVLLLAAVGYALVYLDSSTSIADVLDRRATLQCHMHDGIRVIEPDKIKYFHEGTWVFTEGGYAKSCRIIKK